MTSRQRKAHRIIWILLVIIMPVLMYLVIKDLNFQAPEKNSVIIKNTSDSTILKTNENELIKTNLYSNHLEIIVKSPLKNASSVAYTINKAGDHISAIGHITTSGIYTFNISNIPIGIAIYDDIKKTEITKLFF